MTFPGCILRRALVGAILVGLPFVGATTEADAQPRSGAQAASQATLDSLERVAITGQDYWQRRRAVTVIAVRYGAKYSAVPQLGVVARLGRIYRSVSDELLRDTILQLLSIQVESGDAAALIAEIAKEPAPATADRLHDDPAGSRQLRAVTSLLEFGTEGQRLLRVLHSQAAVREPSAKEFLDRAARREFRPPVR